MERRAGRESLCGLSEGSGRRVRPVPTQDLSYSPDGKLLATVHWYNADPGEVKLWDAQTGEPVASLPVPAEEGGVQHSVAPMARLLSPESNRQDRGYVP